MRARVNIATDPISLLIVSADGVEHTALDAANGEFVELALNHWISVNDSLPDSDGNFLVTGKSKTDSHGIANFVNGEFYHDYIEVTHWMPLPDLPW